MSDVTTVASSLRSMLEFENVTKRFGASTVVDIDRLRLGEHPIEGLIGPNGAGKTTLMRLIMQSTSPDTGTITFVDRHDSSGHDDRPAAAGVALTRLAPHEISGLGVVKANQITQDFANLTIWDSLLLAVAAPSDEGPTAVFGDRRVLDRHGDEIHWYLDYFDVANPGGFAHSAGERKLVDLIRCLLLHPRILLLDEPTAGLPEDITQRVMELIRTKAGEGVSIVIVEHDLDLIWGSCDVVHFMAEGSVILQGDPATIRSHDTVVEKYLGGGHV